MREELLAAGSGYGQHSSSSTARGLMARMLAALRPADGDTVLEIGTGTGPGTGCNAALLCERLGDQHVHQPRHRRTSRRPGPRRRHHRWKLGDRLKESLERAYEFDQENRSETGPPARLKDPGDVLGSTNAPGLLMLYGLNRQVGDATFQKIEKTFFERFRHKTASTQDYINVANEVSGRDFTAYIKSWIYGAKTPPNPIEAPTSALTPTPTEGHKVRAAGPSSRP
ncbi:hypothetical protein AB0I22_14130 [Streptomyces sp. NPDC050610]|uniref:hypothetical protein n=1 Tax=Streptomyces sp. NPDC050610 TaxID=3157097 RepID=UPI00342F4DAC